MAEIAENWPERIAALNQAMGMRTMEQFGRDLVAGVEAMQRALRDAGYATSMRELGRR